MSTLFLIIFIYLLGIPLYIILLLIEMSSSVNVEFRELKVSDAQDVIMGFAKCSAPGLLEAELDSMSNIIVSYAIFETGLGTNKHNVFYDKGIKLSY